jgi:integrase
MNYLTETLSEAARDPKRATPTVPTAGSSQGPRTKRNYGRGRIYKNPQSSFWYAAFYLRGREVRKSTKLPYDDCGLNERRATEMLGEMMASHRESGVTPARVKYDDLRELIIRDYRINERRSLNSLTSSRLFNLDKFFMHRRARDITATLVDRYIEKRIAEGTAHATRNNELAALKRMFRLGVEKKLITPATVPVIKIVAPDNARQGFIEPLQFAALVSVLPAHLVPICQWLYATGWRVGEARALRWADLDLTEGIAALDGKRTKNREAKKFPFAQVALAAESIERAKAGHIEGCPWVFHRKGKRIGEFRNEWKKACEAAELEPRYIHDMRRAAVRNLVLAGVSEQDAMRISGHKTVSTFQRYNIGGIDAVRAAARRLDSFLGARMPQSGIIRRGKNTENEESEKKKTAGAKPVLLEKMPESVEGFECRGRDSNPHDPFGSEDFKSSAYAISPPRPQLNMIVKS